MYQFVILPHRNDRWSSACSADQDSVQRLGSKDDLVCLGSAEPQGIQLSDMGKYNRWHPYSL